MTADDAIVTCTCGRPHRYDTDPHEWKPPAADDPKAVGAPANWPHGYLPCGCRNDGKGRHVR